jgi:EAL domain-containing protein (putative c-di-GMP-specific phosphodiesterase class I)
MSTSNCQVCRIQSTCTSANVYLYAPTPALCGRIESVLSSHRIPFTFKGGTFGLRPEGDKNHVVNVLRQELSAPEALDLRVTFDLVNLMAATSLEQFGKRVDTQWFADALVKDQFVYYFQPIVDTAAREVFGHESLVRLESDRFYNGGEIIETAIARGDVHVFDSYARGTAIRQAARQGVSKSVFINFQPSSIYDPAFCMASTKRAMAETHYTASDIVFEIVESERVGDSKHLRKIVDYYREQNFRVALDDIGTGSNSLQMIAELQPDFIKLDKSLVWNISTAIGRNTIVKLAELAAESGIQTIAEGVETAEMRDTLIDSGITLMQGYFFGKPAPQPRTSLPDSVYGPGVCGPWVYKPKTTALLPA